METFNVHEAKSRLSELLQRVEEGEVILLARGGKPIAKLSKISPGPRRPGFLGQGFQFDKELFDSADSEIEKLFEDSRIFPE